MLSKSCLRYLLLVSLVLVLIAAAGCGGAERTAQLDQGAYSPQASGPLDIMPPSEMLAAQGNKSVSALTLYLKGSQFSAKPKQLLVAQGDDAQFSPAWDGNWSGFDAIAFGVYRLNVSGYSGSSVINFGWTTPPTDLGDVWIGMSQWTKDRWVWFPAPADGSLELPAPGYTQFTKQGFGDMLIAVVALGNDISLFHEVWIGNTIPVHTIAGDVKTGTSVGIEGVTVSFSGGLQSVLTDATGHYVRDGVYNGTYTATPSKQGCAFTPAYSNVVISGSDSGSINFTTVPAAASGYVKTVGGAGIAGVTMSFTGGVPAVTTDATGLWQVGPIPDGDYTVTPSKNGLTFAPASADFTMAGVAVVVPEMVGSSNMVSGYARTAGGAGIANVTLSFTGGIPDATTDSLGYWQAGPFADGDYTATATKADYTFTPATINFTMAGVDLILANFVGDCNVASGYVKNGSGTGIAGVTVSFTGGLVAVVTDATGLWQRDAIPNGSYTATPAKSGWDFAPLTRNFTINNNDQTLGDFTGTQAAEINILTVTTDKTTHCSDASETASQLNVTTDPTPADTYTWSGEGDFSNTAIANPTWKPNGTTKLGKVTLTVTVTLGAANDTATIDLYVTTETIKTNFQGAQIGIPPGSGKAPDFDMSAMQYLEPLIDGGDISAATGTFYEKIEGRPVLFDRWETW